MIPTGDCRALQVTPVNYKEGRALPGVTISSKTTGPYRQLTVLSYSEYRGRTPGPCSPPETVGNTGSSQHPEYRLLPPSIVQSWLAHPHPRTMAHSNNSWSPFHPSNILDPRMRSLCFFSRYWEIFILASDLVQSQSQPSPPACPSPSKGLPLDSLLPLIIAILSFIIISSLISLF